MLTNISLFLIQTQSIFWKHNSNATSSQFSKDALSYVTYLIIEGYNSASVLCISQRKSEHKH